jgi:hypothetical protein
MTFLWHADFSAMMGFLGFRGGVLCGDLRGDTEVLTGIQLNS